MDRFKFRIWDKGRKCFFNDDEVVIYPNGEESFFNADYDFTECVVEQCTGVKDESEDLIYESDIVELDDGTELVNAVIEWDGNAGCWNIRTYDTIYTFDNLYGNKMRVIGNIHENPELLEKSNEM